ncbi:MAG TPA: hypothetical protein VEF72_11430 [Mycobacterium sp.]|nr:hypothetical protein [Mycobacterium sp.]
MSHGTTWLIAIVAGLVAIVLAVVLIVRLLAPGSNTHPATNTSAPMSQPTPPHATAAPPPPPAVELRPGAHSPLADVDLPAGVVFAGNSSNEERWRYTAPYDDTVAFLRKQFATGRKYDAQGATWWRDLPPCYNDKYDSNSATPRHESPPGGWVMEDSTLWLWADASISLSVEVFRPGSTDTPNEIVIDYTPWGHAYVCNRD